MQKKWEYKVIGLRDILPYNKDKSLEEEFNKYGREGWELVNIVDQIDSAFGGSAKVEYNFILFKRELE